jgi:hypothetical protein
MPRFSALAAALVLGVGVSACGRTAGAFQPGSVQPADGTVTVRVANDNYSDMDVYVVSEGVATEMGMVTGHTDARFALAPSFFPTNQLRLVATPIGGNGRAASGPLDVSPGDTVEFTIRPLLRNSAAVVH